MPPDSRFSHLEHPEEGSLPSPVRDAIAKLPRFNHLEIGTAPLPASLPTASTKRLCAHCRQANESEREICWACCEPLREALASRPDPPPAVSAPAPQEPLEIFKGQRVTVLRADGKIYRSDDPHVPSEIQELFDYVEKSGVTPALMEHLRRYGTQARFCPAATAAPSPADVSFWDQVRTSAPVAANAPSGSRIGRAVLDSLYGSDLLGIVFLLGILMSIAVGTFYYWRHLQLATALLQQ